MDRSQHSYTYKANHAGNYTIKFMVDEVYKEIPLVIAASDVNIEADTDSLALYLSSQGRSNNDESRNVWTYEDISATFTDFGWVLDGWLSDDDGITVLRTLGDARVTIPYKPFLQDFLNTGKVIEFEFSTHNVIDYNAPIISCFANNIGVKITSQSILFKGSQTELTQYFKENEHIRVSIVVERQTKNRLIEFYINGIMSAAVQYPSGENFRQGTDQVAVGITIGSNLCGVDLYNIRIYDKDMESDEIINNWVADTQVGDLMIDRFNRNNIFEAKKITIGSLPSNMPYWIINAPELP